MEWPTGLFRWSSYDRRKADAADSAAPATDAGRPIAVATEPDVRRNGKHAHAKVVTIKGPESLETRESAAAVDTTEMPPDTGHAVHDLLKGLEVNFGIEAAQVEREALETARSWAEKGLPRHDLEANGQLEVEGMLAHRASHVLSDWAHRVRERLEGAIHSETEQLGAQLITLEQRLLRYRYRLDELRSGRDAVARAQSRDELHAAETAKAPKRRVAYAARLGAIPFWVFCIILVLADFVANVPVFNELLPSSPAASQALQNIETNAAANPTTYGWTTFWAKLGMHLDASILAFSVVLFLVVLGHFFGASLRTIVALHRARPVVDDELLLKHRHQPTVVAWLSFAGILTIVTVLFLARAGIESASRNRVQRIEASVAAKQQQLAQAQQRNDATLVQQLEVERQTLEGLVPVLRARHEYAVSIAAINWPIAALNLVLALCAALLAYQHQSENLELDATPAQAPSAREKYGALRTAAEDERGEICVLSSHMATRIKRLTHFSETRPLLRADGKADRLRRVVPMFRAENARARGLDTRSILAFRSPIPDLAPAIDDSACPLPDVFQESLKRYADLQSEFLTLERDRVVATETSL